MTLKSILRVERLEVMTPGETSHWRESESVEENSFLDLSF